MNKRMIPMLAMLLAAVQTDARAVAPASAFSPEKVLPICEKALEAALDGRDAGEAVQAAVKDMPEDRRQAVLAVCGIYLSGAISMLKRVSEAPRIAPGGTSI